MISNITNNGLKVNVIKGASVETITSATASCLASKSTATDKATEASASASSASTSASIATAQASIATTKANEASVSATSAESSATIATAKAISATTSEANALYYKDSASTSATVATTKASEASISAGSASTSEANALSYKDSANTSANTATTKANESQISAWEAEAEAMTSESYATEAVDVFVKKYTSNGNGTFTATITTDFSALHWAEKALDAAQGDAVDISYDNSTSNLTSSNVQDGLDEIAVRPSGFKNYIINGKKAVNQRVLTSTDNSYNQDRWYKAGVNWYQGIEGDNNLISGKTYTLSWVGTATASYYVGTATSVTINAQSFTAISNDGNFILTITTGQNLWVKFSSDAMGSTFNYVQLEEGSIATPFEQRPIGLELSLCQRYYQVIAWSDRKTATAAGQYLHQSIRLPVAMRVNPTTITNISAGSVVNAVFIGSATLSNIHFRVEAASSAAGDSYILNRVDALSSEL